MNMFLGTSVSLLAIVIFYLYVFISLRYCKVDKIIKYGRYEVLGVMALFCLTTFFIYFQLKRNSFIYYWDYTMHWIPIASMRSSLFSNPIDTLKTIYDTIGSTDYNWTMPLLYVLPTKIFGVSYEKTVLLVYIFYMFPAIIISAVCIREYVKKMCIKTYSIIVYMLFVIFMPFVFVVLLRGFMDPAVMILASVILLLIKDFPYDQWDIKRCLLLIIGLVSIVIFRRHWAYWVIGIILFLVITFAWDIKKETLSEQLKYFVYNMFTVGIIGIFALIFPFRNFTKYALRDYSSLYVAWNSSWDGKIDMINQYIGYYFILMIFFIVPLWIKRKEARKYIIAFFLLLIIPIVIMMQSVTMHNSHFYFTILPISILFIAGFTALVTEIISSKVFKRVLVALLSIYLVINFSFCYKMPEWVTNGKLINKTLFCNMNYSPFYREDIANVKSVVSDIINLKQNSDKNTYICASSHNINAHLISLAFAPEQLYIDGILPNSDTDSRDGFNTSFFDADVIVVENVIQCDVNYLDNEGVIRFLQREIMNPNSLIGRHFELYSQYDLNYVGTSEARIYIKTSDWEECDYEYLINYYDELYPDKKETFSDRITDYMIEKGIK